MSETPETPEPIEDEIQPVESNAETTSETVSPNVDEAANESVSQEAPAAEAESNAEHPTAEGVQQEADETVESGESIESEATAAESEQLSEEQVDELENVEFPEASFDMLLMQHHTQAMLAMGMIPDPATGQVIKNKSAAKFHIDMLGIIQERTKGNLNQGEEEALNGVLHNLRMMFVEVSK